MDNFDSYDEYLNYTANAPDDHFYDKSIKTNTKQAFEEYIKHYPNGLHVKEANVKIDEFIKIEKDNNLYEIAKKKKNNGCL